MNRYIECKTQEQWNIIVDWAAKKYKEKSEKWFKNWADYSENSVIDLMSSTWGYGSKISSYYKNSPSITFEEFCKQEGINIDKNMKTTQQEIDELKAKLQELEDKVKSENEFKVGDWVYISKFPGCWASNFNNNYPGNANYPIIAKIDNLEKRPDNLISASIGDFGWDFTALKEKSCIRKATLAEVTKYLVKEANIKYPKGTRFKTLSSTKDVYISGGEAIVPAFTNDTIGNCDGGILYSEGVWAEIIKEEEIEISDYKAVFNKADKTVKFGCKTIAKQDLEAILIVMKLNEKFDHLFYISDIDISSEDYISEGVSKETIQKLIKALE